MKGTFFISHPKRASAFITAFAVLLCSNGCTDKGPPQENPHLKQWQIEGFKRIGAISLDEGRAIAEIRNTAAQCARSTEVDVTNLLTLYKENEDPFLKFVILDQLAKLDKLSAAESFDDPLVRFAKFYEEDRDRAIEYVEQLLESMRKETSEDARQQHFDRILGKRLQAWVIMREGPEAFLDSRPRRVNVWHQVVEERMKDLSLDERVALLFDALEEWESPLEYEACFSLIKDIYQKRPDAIANALRKSLLASIPDGGLPPPYTRQHTVFHEVCFLAMIIGDTRLRDPLERAVRDPNEYARCKAGTAVEWLREEIAYPWEYEDAARAHVTCKR